MTSDAAAEAPGPLDAEADDLYALTPDEFTAARDARSARLKADGDRDLAARVRALRRPTVAAWLVNALVRHRESEIEQLLDLGDALRAAQGALEADQLRELGRQRQAVLAAVGRQARALARELGRPVTEPVADAVEETLRAALADPGAAAAVRTGRLTAPLTYAGFGEVDLDGAVATPGPRLRQLPRSEPAPAGARTDRDADREADRDADRDARRRQDRAREELAAAAAARSRSEAAERRAAQHRDAVERRARAARERSDSAQVRVDELEQVLGSARAVLARALEAWTPLQAQADTAAELARQATADADRDRAAERRARARAREAGLAEG